MSDYINVPVDLAREMAKFIRNNDNGSLEHWAGHLDPVNLSDRIFRIVNFYIKSDGDPNMATNEIINELINVVNNVKIIEEVFLIKKDLISLLEIKNVG
jgi:hypothetical protein